MEKSIFICLTFLFITLLFNGCSTGIIPDPPDDQYDDENTELSYIKVIPSNVELSFNQSKKFEVKAYNLDDRLIAMDTSQIKWTCTYECIACGVVCSVSPLTGSTQTTFKATNPEKTGRFEVWVNYGGTGGKWAKAVVQVN